MVDGPIWRSKAPSCRCAPQLSAAALLQLIATRHEALIGHRTSITVVIFCWHILLISESMDHHDLEIMDDRSID